MINLQVLGATASLSLDGKEISATSNPLGILHGNTIQAGEHNVLAAFDRVSLQPGETANVNVPVSRRSLEYWSGGRWMTAVGGRTVYVGASSRDLRSQAETVIAR